MQNPIVAPLYDGHAGNMVNSQPTFGVPEVRASSVASNRLELMLVSWRISPALSGLGKVETLGKL